MHSITRFLILQIFLFTETVASGQDTVRDHLDTYLTNISKLGFSGSIVVSDNSKLVLKAGYGKSHSETADSIDEHSAFYIASLGKQFTGTLFMKLELDGTVNLSDPIQKYLDFPLEGQKKEITIAELLNHSSGLGNFYRDNYPGKEPLAFIKKMFKEELLNAPGKRYRYSNFGYYLLNYIAVVASGMDYSPENFETLLNNKMLESAGMTETGLHIPKWSDTQIIFSPKTSTKDLKKQRELILTSVEDLHKWYEYLFKSREFSAFFLENLFKDLKFNYNYGWRVHTNGQGEKIIFHGGYDDRFHYTSIMYYNLDRDRLIIALSNTIANRQFLAEYLLDPIVRTLGGKPVSSYSIGPAKNFDLTIEGTYAFMNESKFRIKKSKGFYSLSAADSKAVRLLKVPEYDKSTNPLPEQSDISRIFSGINDGDYSHFNNSLPNLATQENDSAEIRAFWRRTKRALGPYVGLEVLHNVNHIYQGSDEEQIFIKLLFKNGDRKIRILKDKNGKFLITSHRPTSFSQVRLYPISKSELGFWDFHLQRLIRLDFSNPNSVKIRGGTGETTATKK